MGMYRWILRAALAALVTALAVSNALAQTRAEGKTVNEGDQRFQSIGGSDGTSWRVLKTDPSGVLRATEEYPREYQTTNTTIASGSPIHTGYAQVGVSAMFYPWLIASLRVQLAQSNAGGSADTTHLYLMGSDDNVTYFPLVKTGANSKQVVTQDTVRFDFPGAANTTRNWIIRLDDIPYPGRYLGVFAKADSTAASARTITATISLYGRQF